MAAARSAVRAVLQPLDPTDLVLVACSGGADSLALAEALGFEADRTQRPAGAVVVDHGLQHGSDDVCRRTARTLRGLGLDPVEVVRADVRPGPGGLEASAREARYAALDAAAERHRAALVLLGHTLDDQAEQVLLGLARGSGARSLAGMPAARGRYRRPLLGLTRAQTRAACEAEGLTWWDDPMNEDPGYARVRARHALAVLEADLGPGVAAALARTARQLRADADLLEDLAAEATAALGEGPWPAESLVTLPEAVRGRVWRLMLVRAGAPVGQVSLRHVEACDRLLTAWRGQGPVHVPGGLRVTRSGGLVVIGPPAPVE